MVLDVADLGTLGDGTNRENVADKKGRCCAELDRLAAVHALGGDDERLLEAAAVGLLEDELGKRGTAPGIVKKRFDNTGHLRRALGGINGTELRGTLAMVRVGSENIPVPLALGADDVTHREGQAKPPKRLR
jgi:hypothetical protein